MSIIATARFLVAATATVLSVGAQAVPVYNVSTPAGIYGASSTFSITGSASDAGVTKVAGSTHAIPVGLPTGASYYYATPSAGLTLAVNSSFLSILWGSPDATNVITLHTTLGDYAYSGANLHTQFGISDTGDQKVSTAFTASLPGGIINSATFTSGVVAFEFAVGQVAAVPEPASIALFAAGLGGLLVVRRRRA